VTLRERWDEQADNWARFARTPGTTTPSSRPDRAATTGSSCSTTTSRGPVKIWEGDRDGIRMTFYDRPIPLSRYAGALETAGLLIERIAEVPSRATRACRSSSTCVR